MRWEGRKCLRCTWTGEWWINPSANRRRAASINPSKRTTNHQSHSRVEERPALSLARFHAQTYFSTFKPTLANPQREKACVLGVNETSELLLRWTQMPLRSLSLLRNKQTDISQLIFPVFSPTTFPGCPAAMPMFSIEKHIRLNPNQSPTRRLQPQE